MIEKIKALREKYQDEVKQINAQIDNLQHDLLLANAKLEVVNDMLGDVEIPNSTLIDENY
jgi:hypothetical protein